MYSYLKNILFPTFLPSILKPWIDSLCKKNIQQHFPPQSLGCFSRKAPRKVWNVPSPQTSYTIPHIYPFWVPLYVVRRHHPSKKTLMFSITEFSFSQVAVLHLYRVIDKLSKCTWKCELDNNFVATCCNFLETTSYIRMGSVRWSLELKF